MSEPIASASGSRLPSVESNPLEQYCKDHGIELKAHNEGTNTSGGYLVPIEFSNDMIDLREQYGVIRRLAKVVPMASETKLVPRRKTGLTAYWVGEAVAATESTKGWDQVQLVAKKLACLALYSSGVERGFNDRHRRRSRRRNRLPVLLYRGQLRDQR